MSDDKGIAGELDLLHVWWWYCVGNFICLKMGA